MKSTYYLSAVALAAMACGCSSDKASGNQAEEAPELPRVELASVHATDVPQTKSYTATVEADNTNNIAPSMANRITGITVEVGDKVAKGQTLVTLDQANITQLKLSLDQAEREYKRAKQLVEIGSGTQQALEQAQAQYESLQSQYKNLMENTTLVSPINGVVTARNYDPGDMTGQLPVLTVGQITPQVKVLIGVTENDFANIKVGNPVTVTFDAYPGEEFAGKINRVYPTVDPATRTFQSEIIVANPQGRILPGMFARVGIDMGSRHNVVVPDRAVVKQSGSGNKYIYVYGADGKVAFKHVELGQRIGDSYEVLSGVNDGDRVVISGQTRLADGVEVEVIEK